MSKRSRRRIGGVAALVAVVSLLALLPSGATAGWTGAYNSNGYLGGYETVGAGYNYWSNNRIYRNPGQTAALWYYNSSGSVGYKTNSTDNPFVHNGGSFGYSIATCNNPNAATMNPATCQAYS